MSFGTHSLVLCPSFGGEGRSLARYDKGVELWNRVTTLDGAKHGPALVLQRAAHTLEISAALGTQKLIPLDVAKEIAKQLDAAYYAPGTTDALGHKTQQTPGARDALPADSQQTLWGIIMLQTHSMQSIKTWSNFYITGKPTKIESYLVQFDLLRKAAASRLRSGGAFPDTVAAILRMEGAMLMHNHKALDLAITRRQLDLAGVSCQMRRLFGYIGSGGHKDAFATMKDPAFSQAGQDEL